MNKILKIGIYLFVFQIMIILIKPFVFPIQNFLSCLVSKILVLNHDGTNIFINGYVLEIEPLCTGILMYFTLVSLFFAFFDLKKAIFYSLISFPIVFVLNLIRIFLTCVLIKNYGNIGIVFHDIYWTIDGIITFILFYFFYKIDERIKDR